MKVYRMDEGGAEDFNFTYEDAYGMEGVYAYSGNPAYRLIVIRQEGTTNSAVLWLTGPGHYTLIPARHPGSGARFRRLSERVYIEMRS